MIRNKLKALKILPGLWAAMMLLSSCATLTGCKQAGCATASYPESAVMPWNYESFVMIRMEITMTPESCSGALAGSETCDSIIASLPERTVAASGSGMVVRSLPYSTFILTADHVCRVEETETVNFPVSQGVTVPIVIKKSMAINTVDFFGNQRSAVFFSSDATNDICLIRTKGQWGNPVRISETLPSRGETAINVAAPMGIFNPGMVPMFQGQYLGNDYAQRHFYSIPARPGSSGSAIMNTRGEIVGVLHSAFRGLEHMSIASSLTSIHELMTTIDDPSRP